MKTAKTILNALHQPVLVLDELLRPILANPAFCRMLGLSATDITGQFIADFVSGPMCVPPITGILEPVIIDEGTVEGIETLCTLPTGRRIHLSVNARWIRSATLPHMLLIEPQDITAATQAELRINVLNSLLHTHVAAVEAANKELDSYSHSVSHDLRTPLRFVNRIAHQLLHAPGAPLPAATAEQVGMILQATDEMGQLIEKLLVFSRSGSVPLKKRRMDPRRLFQDVVRELQLNQGGFIVEIEIEELALCRADRTLLKEVAANLLTNALKFTRRRESALITVGCTKRDGETVYFVRDNGVGFDMRNADELFEPYRRLRNSADFEGTGIGLALVKRIINRHGGRIWAEGEVDKGATFYFTLGSDAVA